MRDSINLVALAILLLLGKEIAGKESGVCYKEEGNEVIPDAANVGLCALLGGDRWEAMESNEFGDWEANPNKDCYITRTERVIVEGQPPYVDERIRCNRVDSGSAAFESNDASGTSGLTRAEARRPPIGRRCTGPNRRWIRKGGRLRCSPWPPRKRTRSSGGFHFADN